MITGRRGIGSAIDAPRARRRSQWAAPAVVALTIVALVAFMAARSRGHGNPDPGRRRLTALSQVSAALPGDAGVINNSGGEPRWDSCDGRAGTFGWDDITVVYQFTTGQPPNRMLAAATVDLQRSGWTVAEQQSPIGPSLTGRKTIETSVPLRVTLSPGEQSPGGPISWSLVASAPPVGQRSSGC